MRSKLLIASMALALSTSVAGSARAVMIAGWDFSQYAIDGFITVDGENLTDTLPANYSSLDPTFGAGAESAAFGRLYLNGQFGSDATPLDFTDSLVPSAANPGSLGPIPDGPGPCTSYGADRNVTITVAGVATLTCTSLTSPRLKPACSALRL